MNNYLSFYGLLLPTVLFLGCQQKVELPKVKLTQINPLSLTDVTYAGSRDTVLVSTYSGVIVRRIKGKLKPEKMAEVEDEIYSLIFAKKRNRIFAATLHLGVIELDGSTGKEINRLPIADSWTNHLHISQDEKFLVAYDLKGRNYIWNLEKDYELLQIPEKLSTMRVRLTSSGAIYFSGNGKIATWHPEKNATGESFEVSGKLVDVDESGNLLLLEHNRLKVYGSNADTLVLDTKHPDWPFYLAAQDSIVHIPLQLKLTDARFTKDYIFTAGVDRSIRKWEKSTFDILETLTNHRATISALDVSPNQTQLVSVDLKGGIHFGDLD